MKTILALLIALMVSPALAQPMVPPGSSALVIGGAVVGGAAGCVPYQQVSAASSGCNSSLTNDGSGNVVANTLVTGGNITGGLDLLISRNIDITSSNAGFSVYNGATFLVGFGTHLWWTGGGGNDMAFGSGTGLGIEMFVNNLTTPSLKMYSSGGLFIGASPSDPGTNNMNVKGAMSFGNLDMTPTGVSSAMFIHMLDGTVNYGLRIDIEASMAAESPKGLYIYNNPGSVAGGDGIFMTNLGSHGIDLDNQLGTGINVGNSVSGGFGITVDSSNSAVGIHVTNDPPSTGIGIKIVSNAGATGDSFDIYNDAVKVLGVAADGSLYGTVGTIESDSQSVAPITSRNTATTTLPLVANFLAPNTSTDATPGFGPYFNLGVATSSNNAAYWQFQYIGSGSASNYVSVGLYGGNPTASFFATGTASSSVSTGGLVVAGGLGVSGKIWNGDEIDIQNTATQNAIFAMRAGTGFGQINFLQGGASKNQIFNDNSTNNLDFYTNGSGVVALRILQNGTGVALPNISATTETDILCYNTGTGLVTHSTVAQQCTVSSIRFKQDITPLDVNRSLDIASRLKPVSFIYRPEMDLGNERHIGFLAEQVSEAAPDLVIYEDGLPHAIKQTELPIIALSAIKALKAEFDAYKRNHP